MIIEGVTMKNKRGQALVEFVIILPIFIFMLLAIIDVGKIISTKNKLESDINSLIDLHTFDLNELKNNLEKTNPKAIIEIKEENEFTTIYLKEEVSIITPGLNLIFTPPYKVKVERSIRK